MHSITQSAALLGVSRQWVHVLINRGDLGTTLIAGRRVVVEDDRFKALQARKVEALAGSK